MKSYKRSICSTCRHATYCSLTSDMSNISSCSEYVHRLDETYPQTIDDPIELFSSNGKKKDKEDKQLVLY